MTTLKNQSPSKTFQQLLKINGDKVDGTLRGVESGDGKAVPLALSTENIAIQGKEWPTGEAPEGAILQVSSDPTKLEWAVPAAAVTNSITTSYFPGQIAPLVGSIRWYPGRPAIIKSVFMSVSSAPTATIMIDVKKSGLSIFGNSPKPVIAISNFKSTIMDLAVNMTAEEYLTVDIISGNGTDLTVRFEYQ